MCDKKVALYIDIEDGLEVLGVFLGHLGYHRSSVAGNQNHNVEVADAGLYLFGEGADA